MTAVELLVWRNREHFATRGGEPHLRPCVLCGNPTPMRSHRGEPTHKTCAEAWNATADTAELRKGRFVSDAAVRRRGDGDHA